MEGTLLPSLQQLPPLLPKNLNVNRKINGSDIFRSITADNQLPLKCLLPGMLLLYLFSELVSFAKETFVKLCRSEIFRQEICLVDIFQIEETKQGETNFSCTTWGKKLRLSMHLLCPLPPSCLFFFLSSSNQMDSCRGGMNTLVIIPKYSICADLIKLVAVWGKP